MTSIPNPPKDSYLIIQKEAAQKYAGGHYGEERFRSLITKPYFKIAILHYFRSADFSPAPKVNIVLLRIKKRDNPVVAIGEEKTYGDFIAYIFRQHGKNFEERMKKIFTRDQFKRQARELKFSLSARPGDLNFKQWLGLFRYFLKGVSLNKQSLINNSCSQLFQKQKTLEKVHRTRKDRKR